MSNTTKDYKSYKKLATFCVVLTLFLPYVFSDAQAQKPVIAGENMSKEIALLESRMKQDFLLEDQPIVNLVYPINGSWVDIDYKSKAASGWSPSTHWDRLIVMAKSFAEKSTKNNKDTSLLNNIIAAIDFWDTIKPASSNYWWNAIGAPLKMGEVIVLMDGNLPNGFVDKIIQWMSLGIKDDHYEYYGIATGQNQVWLAQVHAMIGIVKKDTVALHRAFDAFHDEVYLSSGDGIQPDYSFFQHGQQLYSGGYGIGYTQDIARLIRLSHGTSFQFPEDKIAIFSDFILKGQQWMTYKNVFDYSTIGREISRAKNADARVQLLLKVCEEMASLDIPKKNDFLHMMAGLQNSSGQLFLGNKHFWRADFMVHRTPTFYTSIKMSSSRVKSSEWGNKENENSYYLGQGVQFLLRSGKEYKQIFPVWDWQRLPGTLAEQRDTLPKTSGPWGEGAFGKKPFTGGVSDGRNGMAVNDYEQQNVKAKRAWFCFQHEIIVLGAGIENHSNNPLFQSINQCYLNGPVFIKPTLGGKAIEMGKGTKKWQNIGWMFHDSVGYYFPTKTTVTVKADVQKGSWSGINGSIDSPTDLLEKNIFSAWIDVGKQVKAANFIYAIVPGISKTATEKYTLPVRVIENSEKLQAVWHTGENTLMASFYNAGMVNDTLQQLTVAVNQPVLAIFKVLEQEVEISVSNPLNEGGQVILQVNKKLKGEGCYWDATTKTTSITINLPKGNYAGQSVNKKYSE